MAEDDTPKKIALWVPIAVVAFFGIPMIVFVVIVSLYGR